MRCFFATFFLLAAGCVGCSLIDTSNFAGGRAAYDGGTNVEKGTNEPFDDAGASDAGADADKDGAPLGPHAPRAWRKVTPTPPGPSARHSAAMTYDSARKLVVLFGGSPSSTGDSAETWTWNGNTWSQPGLGVKAVARRGARAVFDSARGMVVLWGGPSDTWEWDGGGTWIERTSVSGAAPTGKRCPGLVYDSKRNVTVLFGGHSEVAEVSMNETWEWISSGTGLNWVKRSPATSPSPRRNPAMAYDERRGKIVLFGGRVAAGASNELWEYDGTNWAQAHPETEIPAGWGACMAYDKARGVTVLFGGGIGNGATLFDKTWEWDGADWKAGPSGPPGLRSCSIVFDEERDEMVLFGGNPIVGAAGRTADMWLYE